MDNLFTTITLLDQKALGNWDPAPEQGDWHPLGFQEGRRQEVQEEGGTGYLHPGQH